MIIQGKYRIEASITDVWRLLMDFKVLEKITPGISELQPLEADKFKTITKIKIGPVKGTFDGHLEIRDKVENSKATLVINQKSKIGNVSAEIIIQLTSVERLTEIDYKGEARLSGKLAMMGQRIIGGVISSLTKQFFESLDNEIKDVINKSNSYAN